jgi:hypothetical protein
LRRRCRPQHDIHGLERGARHLRIKKVPLRSCFLIHAALLDVFGNANHGEPRSIRERLAKTAAEGILIFPERPGERFIGNRQQTGRRRIGRLETTPRDEWDSHRLEVIGHNELKVVRVSVIASLRRGIVFDFDALFIQWTVRRQAGHRRCTLNARYSSKLVQKRFKSSETGRRQPVKASTKT